MSAESSAEPSSGATIFWGVLSLSLAIILGFVVDPDEGAPVPDSLEVAEGVIVWTDRTRKSVSFRLSEYENTLRFGSKGGGVSRIAAALERGASLHSSARVLHDAPNKRPILFGDLVATAYQLEIDGEMVRSWEETDASRRRDNKIFPWLWWGFLLGGAYLVFYGLRKRSESAA